MSVCRGVCVCVSVSRVCVGKKMRGESIGDWDHWYADSSI